ncbi:MAG TPA: hypothetical protein VIV60_00965, partial [Polyangiaceae bacterium]
MRRIQSTVARESALVGAIGAAFLIACSPLQRDMSELKQSAASSGGTINNYPGNTNGGAPVDLGGSASSLSESAQAGGVAGQATAAIGGTDATSIPTAGAPDRGGSAAVTVGGGSAGQTSGASAGNSPLGGSANGGSPMDRAGAGGALLALAGRSGILNQGGIPNVGGLPNAAGALAFAGNSATSAPVCVPTGPEQCTDGIDNDCNGFVDCPIVNGRYPEPGRACSGDDAWASLSTPFRSVKRVECRSGGPLAVGAKAWEICDSLNPTALKVYSMGLAEAHLDASNGLTRFEFRFVYDNDRVSDPNFILYYAHNSLWDDAKGTPKLQCPPTQPDAGFFGAAAPYIAAGTTAQPFAEGDLLLKNPFIRLRFAPTYFGQFEKPAPPQEVKVMSLRHRFVVDPTRKMLLVTRLYQSLRTGGGNCKAAVLMDHVSQVGTSVDHNRFYLAPCDAIVMN